MRKVRYHIRQRDRQPSGYTLVELTVAIGLMAVIAAVFAPILHSVQRSWGARERNAETLANARAFVHHFQRHVSQASRITGVSGPDVSQGYLQFVDSTNNGTAYGVDEGGDIQFGPVGQAADLAGPVSTMRLTCYDGNDLSTPITDANSVRVVEVEATFVSASGSGRDLTVRTAAYVRSGAVGDEEAEQEGEDERDLQPGVALKEKMEWGGSGLIDSYHASTGPYDPDEHGTGAILTVNAIGSDRITMWSGATIYGDAYIGPEGDVEQGITTWSGSQVTGTQGTLEQEVDILDLSAPAGPPFHGSHEGTLELWGSMTEQINTDRYFNKILLWSNSKLIIDGDVTILVNNKVELSSHAEIQIQPGASLRLYVGHNVSVYSHAKLNASTADPSRMHIYMIGNNRTLDMSNHAEIHAVVQNPRGKVNIWSNAQLFGKLKAKRLEGGGRIHVDLDAGFD